MATPSYTLLEKITVGAAGASSVTFSNIPQTGYTDLVVKATTRGDSGYCDVKFQFNNDTASNYSWRHLRGDGSSATSFSSGATTSTYAGDTDGSGTTANTFGNTEIYIPNYTSSNQKSYSCDSVGENNATTAYSHLIAGLWTGTAAITSIKLFNGSGNLVANSTFYLYGVSKLGTTPAIVPYATGGDTIMTDGTYWYHAFKSSGTFTPAKALSCDYLVVAGGGAGYNGGGGAGGLRSTLTATGGGGTLETAKSFSSGTAYTISVGGGGAAYGSNGSNSSIAGTGLTTITSIGGGSTGVLGGGVGNSGGSGGGGQDGGAGGAGTANQGYAGGNTNASGAYAGGGGAGAVGSNSIAGSGGGAGGTGVAISAFASATGTGVSNYYAGGGGGCASTTGGAGGAGGGGNGESNTTGRSAGVANTGGGGGGAYSATGGPSLSYGGSGIVIVRYAV